MFPRIERSLRPDRRHLHNALSAGGFEANSFAADTCAGGAATWVDCRDPEHFFLAFMRVYRTSGDAIRATITAETDPARKARYQARYNWLKNRWFGGAEFYRDPTVVEARRDTVGLQCLRGHASFSFDNCSPGPPTLTVQKILVHPDHNHLRLFNLQIDGVTVRANVNAGSTGPQVVSPGNHTVGETGGTGTSLGDFHTVIGGACADNGAVSLGLGESKTCTITNYDNSGGCRSGSICCEPGVDTQGCLVCSGQGQGCP